MRLLVGSIACLLMSCASTSAPRTLPVGTYAGELDILGVRLLLVLRVQPEQQGEQQVLLDVPQQNATGIPLVVSGDGDEVTLEERRFGITIELTRIEEKSLSGRFSQAGQNIDVVFSKVSDEFDRLRRPQEPRPPFPYSTEDVEFGGGTDGVRLHGTIVIPEGEGPFPAVVLVSGSGPQDRNAMIMGHPTFLVIADHLARNGIASIRFDERGVGKSTGDQISATMYDFSKDLLNALELLRKDPRVDADRIGIVGHSEGSTIAAMAAAESANVEFIVSMAGPARPYRDLVLYQLNKNFRAQSLNQLADSAPEIIDLIARQEPFEKVEELVTRALEDIPEKQGGVTRAMVRAQLLAFFRNFDNPNGRFLLTIDPKKWFSRVRVPVLILQGNYDVQVPREEAAALKNALPDAVRKQAVVEYLRANHLMQTTDDGSALLYGVLPETVSPEALRLIAEFILALPKE